jgi:hypothetical protein
MCLTTCRFCEKIYFGGNLTWIRFVFKLDIFKNNVRFGFILKEVCFNLIGIYFSINRGCLFIEEYESKRREQDVGNKGLRPHKAVVLERNKEVISWYNPRGLGKFFFGSSWGILD